MEHRHGVIGSSSIMQQLYEDVRARILDGSLEEGTRLPSEPEACRIYNVSRTTVREAYLKLQQEGIVEVRRGSGRYIVPGASTILKGSANLLTSMRKHLEALGYAPEIQVLGVVRREPTADEVSLFGTRTNHVIEVERSYVADGDLLTYARNVLAESTVPEWESIDWAESMRTIAVDRGFAVKSLVIDVAAVSLPRPLVSASAPTRLSRGCTPSALHTISAADLPGGRANTHGVTSARYGSSTNTPSTRCLSRGSNPSSRVPIKEPGALTCHKS